jgi:hypothetical protein
MRFRIARRRSFELTHLAQTLMKAPSAEWQARDKEFGAIAAEYGVSGASPDFNCLRLQEFWTQGLQTRSKELLMQVFHQVSESLSGGFCVICVNQTWDWIGQVSLRADDPIKEAMTIGLLELLPEEPVDERMLRALWKIGTLDERSTWVLSAAYNRLPQLITTHRNLFWKKPAI